MSAFAEVALLIWLNINLLFVYSLHQRAVAKGEFKQKLGSNRANGLPSV